MINWIVCPQVSHLLVSTSCIFGIRKLALQCWWVKFADFLQTLTVSPPLVYCFRSAILDFDDQVVGEVDLCDKVQANMKTFSSVIGGPNVPN